jgi:deoxyribodipyrimidine photo-lyase
VVDSSFKEKYDRIPWRNDQGEFDRWCKGETGIPMVDAGMRQLNQTGYMHNRLRMIVAGFLTKNLLIDWRWGEAYFARKLLDYELASNNGGWQWAAGCGTDAAPYFRVFKPDIQQRKFDPQGTYLKRWLPDFGTAGYPPPMVDLKQSRKRAIAVYKRAIG